MLLELRVENLLLIERAALRLSPGLNVITGETGAGKTVLAHALDLLLGGRPRSGIVRPGAEEAYVEGAFAPPPGLLDDPELAELRERLPHGEDVLVLGRRLSAEGRTRAFVGGRSATVADLREVGRRLVAFYGQHEHRKLTVSTSQLEILDSFCGTDQLAERAAYAGAHSRALELRRSLEELRARAGARERDLDLLRFELGEIDALAPSEEERAELVAARGRLARVAALRDAAAGAAEALAPEGGEPGAAAMLAEAERLAAEPEGADAELDALAGRARSLAIEAADLGAELHRYQAALEEDPARLAAVEERLDSYERLERKHGGSVGAVLAHAERCRAEVEHLEGAEVALEESKRALAVAAAEEIEHAAALGLARREAAERLAERVSAELAELAMPGAQFAVELRPRAALGPAGAEDVELLIAPNPGVAAAPLRDTASGGELSRAMLALMSVASTGERRTLVFDEVDAGIGGHTARAVGERLRRLGAGGQVLCITHLPQIASLAERHFRIDKDTGGALVHATVERLDEGAVVDELCRMLGADRGDAGARRHAEELLTAA